jgi:hypothetical protein
MQEDEWQPEETATRRRRRRRRRRRKDTRVGKKWT